MDNDKYIEQFKVVRDKIADWKDQIRRVEGFRGNLDGSRYQAIRRALEAMNDVVHEESLIRV